MSVLKAAMGDAIFTSMWVFSKPAARVLSAIIAAYLGVQARSLVGLFISTVLTTTFILLFIFIGKLLGGANFNPSSTACYYAAGLKPDWSLISMAVRFPAQAVGGVAGVKAALLVMPKQYKNLLRGPSLKVDLHTGGIAEGILTFLFSLSMLLIFFKGPRNMILRVYLFAVATVGLAIAGSGYTGPSMNPANAFGWAYVNNWHNTWEQFYVYWICPFIGAIIAAGVYRILFIQPVISKQKKA